MNEESEKFRKITMKVLTMQLNSITIMDLIAYGGRGSRSDFVCNQNRHLQKTAGVCFIYIFWKRLLENEIIATHLHDTEKIGVPDAVLNKGRSRYFERGTNYCNMSRIIVVG